MILALLLTVHALADSLVLRADDLLHDSTVVALAPHGEYGGLITLMWVSAVVVVLLAGGPLRLRRPISVVNYVTIDPEGVSRVKLRVNKVSVHILKNSPRSSLNISPPLNS